MTQNKKFKKLVRARMKETGETYVQARRALDDGREAAIPQTLRRIGYWYSAQHPDWPDPLHMVNVSWDHEERAKVVAHLKHGHVLLRSILDAWCRLGCGPTKISKFLGRSRALFDGDGVHDESLSAAERLEARKTAAQKAAEANMTGSHVDMGRADLTDGVYVWPEGLVHYLEQHNVRLPVEFVEHVLENPLPPRPEGDPIEFHPYLRLADRSLWDDAWWLSKGKFAKAKAVLERQKAEGDPLNILHDPETWAATGGTEEERVAILNDSPRIVEVSSPFNAGWYFHDAEYPEEGSQGPYRSREDAEQAAKLADYDPTDPDSVGFTHQATATKVLQRYVADHLRRETLKALQDAEGKMNGKSVREAVYDTVLARFGELVKSLEKVGILVPPERDFEVRSLEPTEQDLANGVVRCDVRVSHPERYPQFVRELAEAGLIEAQHLISIKLGEAD